MSAADFLFTPTMQRVLGAAFSQPDRSFFLRELLDLAAGGRGGAQQQIERLIEAGVLVEDERSGRQRSIRVNREFFLYPELEAIVRKSFGVREPLLLALEPFRDEIDHAFVFGSVAKGSDTAASDIDVMVVGRLSKVDLLGPVFTLEQDLGRHIHLHVYAPDEWEELVLRDPVIGGIAAGSVLPIIGNATTA